MKVKYGGNGFDWKVPIEWYATVTDTAFSDKRISLDWTEGAWHGHLEADSIDGIHFSGRYSYRGSASDGGRFALTRYRGGEEVLLFGTYRSDDEQMVGNWMFHLTPRGND